MAFKTLSLVLILILGAALGFAFLWEGSSDETGPVLTGVVVANEVIVAAESGGRLIEVRVTEGDWVTEGDVVAVLDSQEMNAERQRQLALISQLSAKLKQSQEMHNLERERTPSELAGAEARLRLARSQREEAFAEAEQRKKDADRAWDLVKQGLMSRQIGEQRETSSRVAEAQVRSLADQVLAAEAEVELVRANFRQIRVMMQEVSQARAQLEQAEAQLVQISARLDHATVRAPLSGMVSLRVARQGEVVAAGSPIVTVIDLDDIWVKAELEESYIDRIVVGQRLTVRVPSGREVEGEVIFISPEAGFATRRDVSRVKRDIRTFGIKVAVQNTDRRLHSGMTAFLTIPREELAPAAIGRSRAIAEGLRRDEQTLARAVNELERVVTAIERLATTVNDDLIRRQPAPAEWVATQQEPPLTIRTMPALSARSATPDSSARVRELEARVRQLETLVRDQDLAAPEPQPQRLEEVAERVATSPTPTPSTQPGVDPDSVDLRADVSRVNGFDRRPMHEIPDEAAEIVEYLQGLLDADDVNGLGALGLSEYDRDMPVGPVAAAEPSRRPMETELADTVGRKPESSLFEPSSAASGSDSVLDEVAPWQEAPARVSDHGKKAVADLPDPSVLTGLVLQATTVIGEIPVAVVNGEHVFEGDVLADARVIKISDGFIELEYQGQRFPLAF